MNKIGIIGLGRMGSAIARRLQSQGAQVAGWTRSGRIPDGIKGADDLAAITVQSDILILSLYDDAAVGSVLDNLLKGDLKGKLIIETSTVTPDTLKDRMETLHVKGAMAVDAPISGGPDLVAAGQCGVFIGGSEDAALQASKVLANLTKRVFHVGPLGTGHVMKTINNSMLQIYFNGLREMLPLAKRSGLPFETAMRILTGGPAGLPMVKDRLPKILGDDTTVGFTIQATEKDTDVFQRVVQSYGLDAPTLDAFSAWQSEAIAAGLGEADPAALARFAYDAG